MKRSQLPAFSNTTYISMSHLSTTSERATMATTSIAEFLAAHPGATPPNTSFIKAPTMRRSSQVLLGPLYPHSLKNGNQSSFIRHVYTRDGEPYCKSQWLMAPKLPTTGRTGRDSSRARSLSGRLRRVLHHSTSTCNRMTTTQRLGRSVQPISQIKFVSIRRTALLRLGNEGHSSSPRSQSPAAPWGVQATSWAVCPASRLEIPPHSRCHLSEIDRRGLDGKVCVPHERALQIDLCVDLPRYCTVHRQLFNDPLISRFILIWY